MRRALLSLTLLWLAFPVGECEAGLAGRKGKIQGESYVHLRSEPDPGQPPVAVLREGEEVVVESEQGSWYLVSLQDGRRGYVHKTLIQLLPSQKEERAARQGRPLPVIKVVEGREWEILRWLGVGLCIFIIGWICGGNYYLRRDRIRRTKLRF